MRIYWYWPHPHRQASRFALETLRPDDQLTIQALPSLHGESFHAVEHYEVVRDLPDPTSRPRVPGSRWWTRASVTIRRSRARRRLLRRGFDLAHLHMLVYQTDWVEMRSLTRSSALLAGVHDIRPHRRQWPSSVETLVLKKLYRDAGHLLVHHEVLAEELSADFGVDRELVHVLPMPMDATDNRRSTRLPDRPRILLFGSLRENKGVDVLLDAARLLPRPLDAEIVIAGHGSAAMEAMTRERASTLDNVRLELGHISPERKHQLFLEASCVVLPYTAFHSQSAVLADAYSYRVPLAVSDVGAIGPTVREDRTGVVVSPGDAEALAEALTGLVTHLDRELIGRIDAAVRRADYSVVGPRLRQLYDAVLGAA